MSRFKYRPFACVGFASITIMLLIILSDYIFIGSVAALAIGLTILISAIVSKRIRQQILLLYFSASLIFSGLALGAEYTFSYEKAISATAKGAYVQGVLTNDIQSKDSGMYYILKDVNVNSTELSSKLRLHTPSPIDALAGDTVSFKANVKSIKDLDSTYKNTYLADSVYLTAYVFDSEGVDVLNSGDGTVTQAIHLVRNELANRIYSLIPNENGSIIIAMLIGDKSGLSQEMTESFSSSGISHLFAVSGLHLSIWVMGVFLLLDKLGMHRKVNALLSIIFTIGFMVLTGFSASVMRSGFMLIIMLLGLIIGRVQDSLNSLGLSVFVILILNPMQAVDVSLLLSFLATLGIVSMFDVIYNRVTLKVNLISFKAIKKLIKAAIALIIVSLCANIAILPINAFAFGKVSVVSPITNLFVSYPATLAMILGGVAAILYPLGSLATPVAFLAGFIAKYINSVSDIISSLSFATVNTTSIYFKIGFIISVTIVICSVVLFKENIKRLKAISAGIVVVCISLSCVFAVYNHSMTKLIVTPVGDGISVVVKNGAHSVILGCGGSNYNSSSVIESSLNSNKADMLVIPNANSWNSSASLDLIKSIKFKRVVAGESMNDVLSLNEDLIVSQKFCLNPWDGASIEFVQTQETSYAYCIFNGSDVLIVFDCENPSGLPSKALEADILIISYYLSDSVDLSKFGRIVVSSGSSVCEDITDNLNDKGIASYSTADNKALSFELRNKGAISAYYN